MCRRRLHPPRRTVLLVALLEVLLLQAERPPPIRSGGPEVSGSAVQRANQHAEHAGRGVQHHFFAPEKRCLIRSARR